MPLRRLALIAFWVCVVAFMVVMAWDLVIEQPRLSGDQICVQDAGAARMFGADGPGVYKFDRETARPVRIPASMAFQMVFKGLVSPSYSGQSKCGLKALTQKPDGLIAIGSVLGGVVALGIWGFGRIRR